MTSNDRLDRRDVVRHLLKGRQDTVVVSGLGASTYDVAAAGDHARNFYLWGAMGGAALIGLGVALAQPTVPVVVITGDGEMLMGLGGLATVGLQQPANLTIVVLDNGCYGETGGQPSHTAATADLAAVARGCGIADAREILTVSELAAFAPSLHAVSQGPRLAVVKIDSAEQERVLAHRDGHFLVARVRQSLGFQPI